MKTIIIFLSLIISLGIISCDTTEPPLNSAITLKIEEESCTEAWIELTTTNLQLPAIITLKQTDPTGEIKSQILNLITQDSLLYIDSLLPNTTYNYQVSCIQNPVSSNELTVTTMDTTSHDFTFETFTFGGNAGSCVLYDVAIVDENNIWAVGEIYLNDSLGQPDPKRYNAVNWNGNDWNIMRIPYNYQGTDFYHPIQSVYAFGPNDIWFCGNGVIHWDGNNFNPVPIPSIVWGPYQMNKLWGSSGNDLYVVGNNGNIARYLNGTWSRIESGTDTNINDVWGIVDQATEAQTIYCAVSFVFQPGDQKILTIKNNNVDSLSWNTGRRVHTVWTNSKNYVYVAGGGIFENNKRYWNEITQVPLYYSRNIRADDINNIFVCGDYGLFAHFNGSTWKTYNELSIQGIYFSVAVKGTIVITVGLEGGKAIIVRGSRN
jgi:hypothetical protein